jgi:hypothetical protein
MKCNLEMGGKPGQSICQDCVTELLKNKTPTELVALAKVGLDAVIDELTGYEYVRQKGDLAKRHKKYSEEK